MYQITAAVEFEYDHGGVTDKVFFVKCECPAVGFTMLEEIITAYEERNHCTMTDIQTKCNRIQ